jgi:hypothetical protein
MIKREAILQAILTMLDGIVVAGIADPIPAYRSREKAFAAGQTPAIVILPGQDNPSSPTMTEIDWTMTVRMGVYTRGDVPDSIAAPIVGAIHAAFGADLSLGGLVMDIAPGAVSFDFDSSDKEAGATLLSYIFKYRTREIDLT